MDLVASLDRYRLLEHPFYRRWEAGALHEGELASYASQYRYFEAMLPGFLTELIEHLDSDTARAPVAANLADEVDGEVSHLELFEGFARAVGAPEADASPAMAALCSLYRSAVTDPSFALGVLAGYELQAAEVAASKGDGLATHYGLDAEGCAFWTLHASLEDDHAAWTIDAATTAERDRFTAGALASAQAWWSFLDERELLAA